MPPGSLPTLLLVIPFLLKGFPTARSACDGPCHAHCSIGTEHEKFCFRKRDFRPAEYVDIKFMLVGLVSRSVADPLPAPRTSPCNKVSRMSAVLCWMRRHGWEPIMEKENIIGAKKDSKSVTLEPGGQLELSGALIFCGVVCHSDRP